MKPKQFLILSLILITAIFLFLSPRYNFNQLESKIRLNYSSIEDVRSIVNNNIEERSGRENGIKSPQEIEEISINISEDLNKISQLLDEYEGQLNKQGKYVFLLPSKYKEYYNLNLESGNKYISSLRKFKALKEYESGLIDTFKKGDRYSQEMYGITEDKEIDWFEIQKLINSYTNTTQNVEQYYKEGFITESFYNAIMANINANSELFKLYKGFFEDQYSIEQFNEINDEINKNYNSEDISTEFYDSYDKITKVKQQEWSDLYNQSIELRNQALGFYDDNHLATDPYSTFLSKFFKKDILNLNSNNLKVLPGDVQADLNGDGELDTLRLSYAGGDTEPAIVEAMIAYDKKGNEIGRLPEDLPIKAPSSNTGKVYTPIQEEVKQFVSYDFYTGAHSSQTMFFGLFELTTGGMGILPVCPTKDVRNAFDCLFWSGQAETLIVEDLDKDGVLEVVEIVDEYPKDGPIDNDIQEAVNKEFADLGQDMADGMIRIAKREQGGRGNRVIWGVYSYNGDIFEKQLGEEYEKYYQLVDKYLQRSNTDYPTIMRKNDMSKGSLEYNEFMKDFWTSGL